MMPIGTIRHMMWASKTMRVSSYNLNHMGKKELMYYLKTALIFLDVHMYTYAYVHTCYFEIK